MLINIDIPISKELSGPTFSVSRVINHPKVNYATFTIVTEPGTTNKDLDSFDIEECLLKFVADTIPCWVRHIRDNGIKTLG